MAIVFAVLLMLAGVAVFALFAALPTWLLWNGLMPPLFHLPSLSFWQAMGLLLLSGLLFKSGSTSSSSTK